ncbi:hypothetical protein LRS13_00105 [Svornostia abyssi]|uniref:Uncharacterized protein n=1 Tax=Svornostia abyssi TaxID=2898438 RepID=A0ABY5PH19_9ACTN|nr:hypothetical protein LRS13_00105 [Parviterribacteraceae bacterium J379]
MRHFGGGWRAAAAAFVLIAAPTGVARAEAPAVSCVTPPAADGLEPPCNPYLADSPWAGSHRASYAQASSPLPAPEPGDPLRFRRTGGMVGIPLTPSFTGVYPDGGRSVWTSTVMAPDLRSVYKLDAQTGRIVARFGFPADRRPVTQGGISGAYQVVDRDNRLIVGRGRSIDVYGDAVPGDRLSKIRLLRTLQMPAGALCGSRDELVGITMLYDGRVAFATALGVVGTVPREPERMLPENVVSLSINGAACAKASPRDSALDQVSNSIAADEDGGIYVVTSKAMYRFDWDGTTLSQAWRSGYETGGAASGARLGAGSGSTPTVMGTRAADDKFVVITDGAKLMNLVLMWRGEIPADWQGLPGRDRRIACEIPVTFGNPNLTEAQNEQSVLVRGYGAFVPNNELANARQLAAAPGVTRNILAILSGNVPRLAPRGAERLDWDPKTRTCRSTWANRTVSLPNAIPTMSSHSGLIYAIGQRRGRWGLEGLDWATGASRLWAPSSTSWVSNSAYAATVVGPSGSIWTGTFFGVETFLPAGE